MSLRIRLARGGAKKRPFYSIVVADSRMPRDGRFIEKLGTYNPMLPRENDNRISFNAERVRYWLDQGAKPSDRIERFLSEANVIEKPARPDNPKKAQPKAKAQERLRERQEKEEAARAAAAEAAEAAGDAGGDTAESS